MLISTFPEATLKIKSLFQSSQSTSLVMVIDLANLKKKKQSNEIRLIDKDSMHFPPKKVATQLFCSE